MNKQEILDRIEEIKNSIFYEIDRRASKEHCLEDKCDFDVTIYYEEYKEWCDLEKNVKISVYFYGKWCYNRFINSKRIEK